MLRFRRRASVRGGRTALLATFWSSVAFLATATILGGCTSKCRPGLVLKDGVCRQSVTGEPVGSAGNASSGMANEMDAAGQLARASAASSTGQAGEQSQVLRSAQGAAGSTPPVQGTPSSTSTNNTAGVAGAQSDASGTTASGSAGTAGVDTSGMSAMKGPCPNGGEPVDETCDNRDEDCDGTVDEGITMACGSSARPPCMMGTQTCMAGQWGPCEGAVEPSDEVCDAEGLDENCNGNVNEGCDCVPGEVMPCGVTKGACREGMQMCNAEGKFEAKCVGEVGPKTEVCDGRDDEDCDGRADANDSDCECVNGEKEECQAAGIGVCSRGEKTCNNGKWARCVPDKTGCVCDDNQAPRQCGSSDKGACKLGKERCQEGRWSTVCEGVVEPTTERCDGADTDCDGLTDAADDDANRNCPSGNECNGTRCESTAPPPTMSSSPYHRCASDGDCEGGGICSNAFSPNFCAPRPTNGCPPAPSGYQTAVFFQTGCVIVCSSSGACPSQMPRCADNPFKGSSPNEPDRFCVPGVNGGL